MHRSSLLAGLAILLALGFAACDNETIPAAPGGGAGTIPPVGGTGGTGGTSGAGGDAGNAGIGGSGGQGGGGGASGGGGAGGFGGAGDRGACGNSTDFSELASLEPASNGRMEAAALGITQKCQNTRPNQSNFVSCVATGLRSRLPALSAECAQCYGDLAWCSIDGACNAPCAVDSCNEIQCGSCPGYPACERALDACTGRTPPECGET